MDKKEKLNPETLKRKIIKGTTENGESGGFFQSDHDAARVLYSIESITGLPGNNLDSSHPDTNDKTRMVFYPVKDLRENIKKAINFLPDPENTVAVCWTFGAINTNKKPDAFVNRSKLIRGIAFMKKGDATEYEHALLEDPALLFDLSRAVNNGPVRGIYGNIPVDVQLNPNDAVTIFPSVKGGKIRRSKPFPAGFAAVANSVLPRQR